jgi:hypothetical protein
MSYIDFGIVLFGELLDSVFATSEVPDIILGDNYEKEDEENAKESTPHSPVSYLRSSQSTPESGC